MSSAATNGYAVGANSGSGSSKESPWLTLDYAIANAASGEVIQVNGPDANGDPIRYRAATFYSVANKSLVLQAERRHGVILEAADSQTRIINVSIGTNGPSRTLACYGIVFDGRENTQRALSIGTATPVLGSFATVELYDCAVRDVTLRAVHTSALKSVNLKIRWMHLESVCAAPLIDIDEAQEGAIDIDGMTVDCTAVNAASCIISARQAAGGAGLSFVARGVRGSLVNTAGSATTHGIMAGNISAPVIEYCDVKISGATSGWVYRAYCNLASEDANGAVIRYNRGHNGHSGGHIILVGTETSGVGNARQNDAHIHGNNVTANPAAAQPIHGLMLGYGVGGLVENNVVTGAALATIAKQHSGGVFRGNVIRQAGSEAMRAKGATGTRWEGNTITVSEGYAGDGFAADANNDPATDSTGIEVIGNIFNVDAAPANIVRVNTASSATFENNIYNITATLGADAWENQGTAYQTVVAWKAVEPSARP